MAYVEAPIRAADHHGPATADVQSSARWILRQAQDIWQFMRDNWLSNRVFTSYENLLDHCCEAWNRLIDQLWRIMSIGMRDWADEF
jgi:hypothetical protein